MSTIETVKNVVNTTELVVNEVDAKFSNFVIL